MIKIDHISQDYKNNDGTVSHVLHDLSCVIEKGQFISFVGKSGCGKTTLVKILAGYIEPTKGSVFIDNKKVSSPSHERIVVHQENDIFDWMTVHENIKLVCKDKQIIDQMLKIGQLDRQGNYYPSELSGGMKKRLSLIRALAAGPQILILDEPFASLDYFTKEALHLELLKLLQKTTMTVLLVTHDIDEAIFLSDKVVVLEGKPASIKRSFSIPFPRPRVLDMSSKLLLRLRSEIRSCY